MHYNTRQTPWKGTPYVQTTRPLIVSCYHHDLHPWNVNPVVVWFVTHPFTSTLGCGLHKLICGFMMSGLVNPKKKYSKSASVLSKTAYKCNFIPTFKVFKSSCFLKRGSVFNNWKCCDKSGKIETFFHYQSGRPSK